MVPKAMIREWESEVERLADRQKQLVTLIAAAVAANGEPKPRAAPNADDGTAAESVLAALRAYSEGLSMGKVAEHAGVTVDVAIRCVRGLIKSGQVRVEGERRAKKYFAVDAGA